ncbi:lipoprotein [Massiliimalia massiliensis]|uniref:lipoprotein n=1 Tax=Massiliimalia massiliensis TaxID=1852384 RepID=UPI0009867CDC|nr:lipoprotein [Massiliimalia massiliensis]
MKKKSLLGILAILMVIALALTGCGQKGEQNTGATGSEGQNETVENGDGVVESDNDDVTDVDSPVGDTPTQDADGNYVYVITLDGVQTEIRTCVNVWDYITDDTPYDRVELTRMAEDLGWERLPAGFGAAMYTRNDGTCASITGSRTDKSYDLATGERRLYQVEAHCIDENMDVIKFSATTISALSVSDAPYLIGESETYVSFEQIVMYAYLVDYYRYNNERLYLKGMMGP